MVKDLGCYENKQVQFDTEIVHVICSGRHFKVSSSIYMLKLGHIRTAHYELDLVQTFQ